MNSEYKSKKIKLKITSTEHRPLKYEEINSFEIENNVKLPNDFKEFIIKYNGATFDKNRFYISETKFFELENIIEFQKMEFYDLGSAAFFHESDEELHKKLLVIYDVDHPHGDCLGLILGEKEPGKILYSDCNDIKILANNWDEFINNSNPGFGNEFEEVCFLENKEKIIKLITSGFDLNIQLEDPDNPTPLSLIIEKCKENKNFEEIVDLILNSNYLVLDSDLNSAIKSNNFEIMKKVFEKIKVKIKYLILRIS